MIICKKEACCGCLMCESVCPKKAIHATTDKYGFVRPEIDTELCVECGLCQKKCPENIASKDDKPLMSLAANNLNTNERLSSTSGGIFLLLAKQIIREEGVVCGCVYDEDMMPVHRIATCENQLSAMQGSKYVQSNTEGIWEQLENHLSQGKKVLFCGLPCQCAALKSYLDSDYENLLTVDLVCHGVPSQRLWKRYLDEYFPDGVTNACFRDKTKGWDGFSMKIYDASGKTYRKSKFRDPFIRIFLGNSALRESCYSCRYKKNNYLSDITLGDFWGINRFAPHLNDDKGTSAVVIRTKRGMDALDLIKDKIKYEECSVEAITRSNLSLNSSSAPHPERAEMLRMLENNEDFSKIVVKFGKSMDFRTVIKIKTKNRIKRVFCGLCRLVKR